MVETEDHLGEAPLASMDSIAPTPVKTPVITINKLAKYHETVDKLTDERDNLLEEHEKGAEVVKKNKFSERKPRENASNNRKDINTDDQSNAMCIGENNSNTNTTKANDTNASKAQDSNINITSSNCMMVPTSGTSKSTECVYSNTNTNNNQEYTSSNNNLKPANIGRSASSEHVKFMDKASTNTLNIENVRFEKDSIMSSSHHSLEDDDFYNESDKPKIPDGGWGWMVVFSSLILSMIMDGISFSFGLLYIEFLNEFGASKSATAWIGSLFLSVPLSTGPIMSAFVDHYGCRKMTIVGGLISTLGFVLSVYAKSVTTLYFTFGIIAGLGLGLCYVTAVVSIAFWFDKKRNLAVGLGACGTGIGTFVYAPLTQMLIEAFGWRSTTLLLSGTFLNMCVCGALMREPEWMKKSNKAGSLSKSTNKKSTSTTSVSTRSAADDFPDVEEIRKFLQNDIKNEYQLQSLIMSLQSPKTSPLSPKELHRSDVNLPTFVKQNERVPLEVLEKLSSNKRLYNVILENYPSLLSCRSTSDKGLDKIMEEVNTRVPVTMNLKLKKTGVDRVKKSMVHQHSLPEKTDHEPLMMQRKNSMPADALPWYKKTFTAHNHNHFKNIRLHRNSVMYRGAMLNIRKYRLRASSCPNIYKNSMTTLARESDEKWYSQGLHILKGMMDFSMFSELHFIWLSISTILLFIWFVIPYLCLAEHMTRNDYTEKDASNVLAIIGVTNTIGMLGLGWAGDQPWLNVTKTFATCLVLCGVSVFGMLLFTHNYIMLCMSAGAFGLFFASSFAYTPIILVELVPLERFTVGYGLILLCQGIGNLIGPPLAGLLFDLTNSWDQAFIQSGIGIILSGFFLILISFTKNRKLWGSGPLEKESGSDKTSIA